MKATDFEEWIDDCSVTHAPPFSTLEKTTTLSQKPLEQCKIEWEEFVPAMLKGPEEFDRKEFAGRVGFIEEKTAPAVAKEHLKTFLGFQNSQIPGGAEYDMRNWIAANEWIYTLEPGENRYVNLRLKTNEKMMLLVYRCSEFAIGIFPTKIDQKLIAQNTVISNWEKDFDHLADCEHRYKDLSNGTNVNPENRVFKFKDQTDINKPKYQVLHFDVGIQFLDEANKFITKQQIEAAKYKFGYTIPLRDETFNESYEDYTRVEFFGPHLLPIDLGFEQLKSYKVQITFKMIPFGLLVKSNIANEADKEEWLNKTVTLEVDQDLFVCGGIKTNFFMPRMTADAKIEGADKYFYNQGKIYDVYYQGELVASYTYVAKEYYKLYEERDY